jgi:hypothetical protein
VEIKRITLEDQPRQKVHETSYLSSIPKLFGEAQIGGSQSILAQTKARPYMKNNQSKRAGGVAQAADSLPSKCKALSLNLVASKKM